MKFCQYIELDEYKEVVFDLLLEDEAANNLIISVILDSNKDAYKNWFMATICDEFNRVVLVAFSAIKGNLMLFKPNRCGYLKTSDNNSTTASQEPIKSSYSLNDALTCLLQHLKLCNFSLIEVFAELNLAHEFSILYYGDFSDRLQRTSVAMKLSKLSNYKISDGFFRPLEENDLSFAVSWEKAFYDECRLSFSSPNLSESRIRARIGTNRHFIWEVNSTPVSQAVYGRDTPNSGIINWVYTPPEFRGYGFGSCVVAEVSKFILSRGKKFCCLFADFDNPTSRKIYSNLGYIDVENFGQIHFDKSSL